MNMNDKMRRDTEAWWAGLLADDQKMTRWLLKIQRTEYEGYTGHMDYLAAHPELPDRERQILVNVAKDELRHSYLFLSLMSSTMTERRRDDLLSHGLPHSTYWEHMNAHVRTFQDYCAVQYWGESAACDRFAVIASMEETPRTLLNVIEMVLPDEVYHRQVFRSLAGVAMIGRFRAIHEEALEKIGVRP